MLPLFLLVSAVVIVTPGQDTALTIRNSLLGGRRAGVFTAVGVSSGQLLWAVATSFGLAALLAASEPAFVALKLVGAAYLGFLGVQSLLAAWRGRGGSDEHRRARRRLGSPAAYRQGLLSNLGNPKMAVFFTSLLPQFGSSFAALLALGLLFCCLTLGWLSAYAVAVARGERVLRKAGVRRLLDAVTGIALIALGARVAAER
jgi:threonine/homoserine/homoserine lactone efflux protein